MNFREIAKKLGVSIATVSRVYNQKPGVGQDIRERIEDELKENGYCLDRSRDLDNVEEKDLALMLFVVYEGKNYNVERSADYFAGILLGAEKRAKELGYLLSIVHVNEENFEGFMTASREVRLSRGVFLFATDLTPDKFDILDGCPVPVMVVDNEMKLRSYNTICADNYFGTYKALEYLKQLGHRKIGFFAPMCPIGGMPLREKYFYEVMRELALKIDERFIVRADHVLVEGVRQINAYLDQAKELPTAFFASNDSIGVSAIMALKQHGYSVPEDVSIIGFDDVEIGNASDPRLTTIRIDLADIGRIGVNRLAELINGDKNIQHIYLETSLVVKESTRTVEGQE
jgi:DNA-binding LacI/PurR family transcriptional regulator